MKPCEYYHSKDPIENLKLRVSIRKVAVGVTEKQEQARRKPKSQDTKTSLVRDQLRSISIGWQEKIFGPKEACKYSKESSVSLLGGSANRRVDTEYRNEFIKAAKRHKDFVNQSSPIIIHTYTDKDEYAPKNATTSKISTTNDVLNGTARDVIDIPKGNTSSRRRIGAAGQISREGSYKTMYLMATVDIDENQYTKKKPKFEEHVLLTLQYYPTKMLVSSPGFSTTFEKDDGKMWKKGPKLTTSQFSSNSGAIYEYTVENESTLDEDIVRGIESIDLNEETSNVKQWRHRCGYEVLDLPPQNYDMRLLANLEIVSAMGYEGKDLYIAYKTELPSSRWAFDPSSSLSSMDNMKLGSTQISTCRTAACGESPLAYFGLPIELKMLHQTSSNLLSKCNSPHLILSVFSLDNWDRVVLEGYASVTLPTAAGHHDFQVETLCPQGNVQSQMKNFFVGGSNQLLDPKMINLKFFQDEKLDYSSEFGFQSKTSGTVRLRANVLLQRKSNENFKGKDMLDNLTAKRGVTDILSSLKSRKRLDSRMSSNISNGSSVNEILSRVQSRQSIQRSDNKLQ